MGTPADTLVSKHPSRIAQLKGPVLQYLSMVSKNTPFNGTDQDLYMSIFYPVYRRKPINTLLPTNVRKYNPGIKTAGDYIAKVNAQKNYVQLSNSEMSTLKSVAEKLGLSWESLYKQILFESRWNPKARNKSTGARGLIQFIPSTAKAMGYKSSLGLGTTVLLAASGYYVLKQMDIV